MGIFCITRKRPHLAAGGEAALKNNTIYIPMLAAVSTSNNGKI
jgi:hypothetical protein